MCLENKDDGPGTGVPATYMGEPNGEAPALSPRVLLHVFLIIQYYLNLESFVF